MELIRVKDHPNLRKDPKSGAILNVDLGAVERHNARIVNLNKEAQLIKDVETLKSELKDIKELLLQLIKGN